MKQNKRTNDTFWFDIFNERYPDEVSEILDELENERNNDNTTRNI